MQGFRGLGFRCLGIRRLGFSHPWVWGLQGSGYGLYGLVFRGEVFGGLRFKGLG